MIGARLVRQEDERFLRGEGHYVADLQLAGALEAVVVRSPHAHAKIEAIHIVAAAGSTGVAAVITSKDLPPNLPPIPCRIPSHGDVTPFLQPLMAKDVVRYVGEPVAVVVAATRALAEDAAELLEIDWEPLDPVSSANHALRPDATAIHAAGNVATAWTIDLGNVEEAFASAAVTVEHRFTTPRQTGLPLETRGLLASYDVSRNQLEVHGAGDREDQRGWSNQRPQAAAGL